MKKTSKVNVISEVVKNNLCTRCGMCISACPKQLIEVDYYNKLLPRIKNEEDCIECGICLKYCAGKGFDYKRFNKSIQGIYYSKLIGKYKDLFIGYSSNKKIRYAASSGGIVTTLLLEKLRNKEIDGAIVASTTDNVFVNKPKIAKSEKEIMNAMTSRYIPIPMNSIFREIKKRKGKFAFVGLPCQIQSLRKAEAEDKNLKKKMILHIGLFCSRVLDVEATKFICNKSRIDLKEIKELHYRGGGWPGKMKVTLKSGKTAYLDKELWDYLFMNAFFTPNRCLLCYDQTNEFADISVGDAWLQEIISKDRLGCSVIITRTSIGSSAIEELIKTKKIEVKRIGSDKIIQSQMWPLLFKKVNIKSRLDLLNIINKKIPEYNVQYIKPGIIDYLIAPIPFIASRISYTKVGYWILGHIPLKIHKIANKFYMKLLFYNKSYRINVR